LEVLVGRSVSHVEQTREGVDRCPSERRRRRSGPARRRASPRCASNTLAGEGADRA
jgi:transposase-like protein